ncbi:sensor histidine kinase [Paraflavitalea sp. CAU 1676]|uniref:tetratricopeptide repeat-containing sensor histidine kinase n=1 Tax=Paraflavitalea sp. CAU 1676 TaxID=3032598 RepID=UPI0023DBED38|nr:sensor histidine kinase [Paraflavitalea sp. CAU 1676]MDF2191863.1 sensor histidine kinase [Paraflavitalea sp. CAU 1676]
MSKAVLIGLLSGLLLSAGARSQSTVKPEASAYSYYPPDKDKESWQRLNLWLSSTYLYVAKEALTDQDSCLLIASRYLGLSRFSILAEGFGDEKLREQSKWIDHSDPNTAIRSLSKVTGKRHLQLLLLLGSYYVFQPAGYSRYKDSVEYFLNKAITESKALKEEKWKRIALCLLGKIYLQAEDPKSDSIYHLLIDQCRKAGDKETEARAIAYRGMYTVPRPTTFQRKLTDLQQAADLYHSIGDIESEINLLMDLNYVFLASGQLQNSHDLALKALSLAESIQYPYTHYMTESLANITIYQGKFGDPLRYIRQTIKVAENCRDSIGWALFYGRLAILYDSEGRQKEGIAMAQKSIRRFEIDRNPAVYNILNIVIQQMHQEGRAKEALHFVSQISKEVSPPVSISDLFFYHSLLSTCYLNMNQLDSAEIHIQKLDSLETLAEAVRGPFRRSAVNERFAELFFKRGQYRKAKEYLETYFKIPSYGHHALMNKLNVYSLLIATDSALGDKEAVISHYKEYIKLLDSNFSVTKVRQAEELQVNYETQEKEGQIVVLNQEAKQSRLIKNLTLAGIIAAIIIAGLLYRQTRLKQKSNRIITHKNEQLQNLVTDKEWLLKEIHHRVKNNLQIIMSLLDSQSRYIDNDAALTAINDSQRRVQAISLIHQKLYQSENTSSIDMPHYIDELVSYLQDSFDTGSRTVIEQNIEPLKLDVAKAIPLGLIINEGIVNAIKYAFSGRQHGIVRIGLKDSDSDYLVLTISDNGIGLPADVNVSRRGSLGFSLMRGLTRQLDGTLTIESNKGLHISVRFSALNNESYD